MLNPFPLSLVSQRPKNLLREPVAVAPADRLSRFVAKADVATEMPETDVYFQFDVVCNVSENTVEYAPLNASTPWLIE
jgi:hypothetical protein